MAPLSANGSGTDTGTLYDEQAQEDLRVREDVKRVAYNYESGEDPRDLHEALQEVLDASKQRLRDLFAKHRWGESVSEM